MKQMPKDTILLKKIDGKSVAYAFELFKDNLGPTCINYDEIYYKAGSTHDTWIDYKRAIQCKDGRRDERIAQALADPDFHVNIYDIPDVIYTDNEGRRTYYSLYDGYYDNQLWFKRNDMNLNVEAINESDVTPEIDPSKFIIYRWDGEDLVVTFPDSIVNAIISLNMMFYEYEVSTGNKVIYRNIKPFISTVDVQVDTDEGTKVKQMYDLRFNVYRWEGLKKTKIITPIGKDRAGEMFVMKDRMEQNAFIFYKGVFYNYTISTGDSRYIKIIGLSPNDEEIDLNKIFVVKMKSNDPEMEARMYSHKGVMNKYKNSIDFLLPVCNSMIVYNGVDHEYTVQDDNAIAYEGSSYSLYDDVNYLSDAVSVNFTKG